MEGKLANTLIGLEQAGVIKKELVPSPYNIPMMAVDKAGKPYCRLVKDFKKLNA